MERYAGKEIARMTLTRVQALIIATGLALVGVAVARAGNDMPAPDERVQAAKWRHFADGQPALSGRIPPLRPSFSRL